MRAPDTFDALKQAIIEQHSGLSGQLKKIGRYATDQPQDVAFNTAASIAAKLGVQPSSLVRFAQAFGFSGFSDMQRLFRSQLMQSFGSIRERVETLGHVNGSGGGDTRMLLEGFVREGIGALESLLDSVGEGVFEEAVSILKEADQIFVLGQGRAFPIAFYLGFALTRLERRSVLLDGIGGMQVQRQQAELASAGDALIAVSFRPYTPLVVEIAAEKKEKGVPVIAITDSPLSPLAEHATVLLEVQEDGERIFLSLIAPMCLAQTLMVSLGQKIAAENPEP